MNKQQRKNPPGFSNFGFSTILLSFVMICIVTIAALSLLTSSSDYKLSQKVAEKNTAYYAAEKQAYEQLAKVDQLLANAYVNNLGSKGYYNELSQSLASIESGTYDRTTRTFSYSIPITETQDLSIELLIQYPTEEAASFYEIMSWKSVYDEIEVNEGFLDLID